AQYEVVVADTVGRQAEFWQRYAFDVEESAVLRWVERVNTQFNDAFSDSATAEANAYFASFLAAARADIRVGAHWQRTSAINKRRVWRHFRGARSQPML